MSSCFAQSHPVPTEVSMDIFTMTGTTSSKSCSRNFFFLQDIVIKIYFNQSVP